MKASVEGVKMERKVFARFGLSSFQGREGLVEAFYRNIELKRGSVRPANDGFSRSSSCDFFDKSGIDGKRGHTMAGFTRREGNGAGPLGELQFDARCKGDSRRRLKCSKQPIVFIIGNRPGKHRLIGIRLHDLQKRETDTFPFAFGKFAASDRPIVEVENFGSLRLRRWGRWRSGRRIGGFLRGLCLGRTGRRLRHRSIHEA